MLTCIAPRVFAFTALALLAGLAAPAAGLAGSKNPIVIENEHEGVSPKVWDVAGGAGDPGLQGFASELSVAPGETVAFKIKSDTPAYRLVIYRMGYYHGLGARQVATVLPASPPPPPQPPCATGPIDCGNWSVSATWAVPADAVSGVYLAKLVRTGGAGSSGGSGGSGGQGSHIPFIVRDDRRHAAILFQTADTTWQAYNNYGAAPGVPASLYDGEVAVSYNRPFRNREVRLENSFLGPEYNLVRFLEKNGFDVSYATGVDTARRGAELLQHKVFLSVGHDEYWSPEQRANVEAALAAGVHLAFLSGNEIFWKTRWDATFHRMTCYKRTTLGGLEDPSGTFTGTWRDPRFRTAADPPRPENALSGTIFGTNNTVARPLVVPAEEGRLRFWRNTAAATTKRCEAAVLAAVLGYEWDHDEDNGFRPPGLFQLSNTSIPRAPVLHGSGTNSPGGYFNDVSGLSTHHLTLYRHASGALVFGAGTIEWSWGLDRSHIAGWGDATLQQAMVNLLADMGVQPGTLAGSLKTAAASLDRTPPVSKLAAPAPGRAVAFGSAVEVTGTATDVGGRVGGVEVSADGGRTWRRAMGRESFRFRWLATTAGEVTLKSRAVDDSGNLETPGAGNPGSPEITVRVDCRNPPCGPRGFFNSEGMEVPGTPWQADARAVQVGVRFRAASDGLVTGIRFWKGAGNTGVHVVDLWTPRTAAIPAPAGGDSVLLASATVLAETASGWQTALFAQPVPIRAGSEYAATYFSTTGYAKDAGYFTAHPVEVPPFKVLGGVLNRGRGALGAANSVADDSNYWVDPLLIPTAALPASLWPDDPTPPAGSYVAAASDASDTADPAGVEVGLRFKAEVDGFITAVRFFQHPENAGPHTVTLWDAEGHELGTGELPLLATAEPPCGWQTVALGHPVAVRAGASYVASYHTRTGYSREPGYFQLKPPEWRGVRNGPLRAPASGEPGEGPNGVLRHGPRGFPDQGAEDANYWVDVVFQTAP